MVEGSRWSRTFALQLAVAAASPLCPARAGTATIGRTWPIAEPDAMAEIEARAARQPVDMAKNFGPRANWSAMQAASLGVTTQARTRSVVPFYILNFDIKLPDGTMLYPKGYAFNPLTYVSLPQRLVVVHPRDLGWAIRTARPTDFILLTAGDALALGEKIGRPLFILEERVKDRLGLTVAPVIVAQAGQRLLLTEVPPSREPEQVAR
ncbi:conjugal transfer protein TraW [Sphingobium baderi]|uniref:conjugal transfer protein TraW n=1 Tax=Sphingobium baderi TaxID=1332080 RepID=UPI002B407592|nr:conjugal transfer protein TraW [Sphingobium baderi]WRD77136.1 conjugal transfer protein TraW [Sphingobium baderi]